MTEPLSRRYECPLCHGNHSSVDCPTLSCNDDPNEQIDWVRLLPPNDGSAS